VGDRLLQRPLGGRSVWKSEGLILPWKPGNAGGGKGPYFWCASEEAEERRSAKRPKTPEKIRIPQRKLYSKARRETDFRFYLLYDKVYRSDVLEHAHRLRRSVGGAVGVGGVGFEDIEAAGGEDWLRALAADLGEGRYNPQPVRRVMIPKAGDHGERLLGILPIRDRVVQTAAVLVLEPIFEADSDPNAYDYCPNRSAQDAVKGVRAAIRGGDGRAWEEGSHRAQALQSRHPSGRGDLASAGEHLHPSPVEGVEEGRPGQ
jgi:RNA-directed DNA polymerase